MHPRISKIFTFLFLLTAFAAGASAQPMMQRPADSAFLLELAQRLADRGEYAEARGILDKIGESEPDNAAVRELQEKIAARPMVARPVVPVSDITDDIISIQKNITRYERRNRDAEFLVRQLLFENDALSETLARRNRTLLELMKKVYGEGAELPEVEIDSDVERSRRVMNSYENQIVSRDRELMARNQELSQIVGRINQLNESIKADAAAQEEDAAAVPQEEIAENLKDKRSYLVDKSIALMDKSRDLTVLQREMAHFSDALKQADVRYTAAIMESEEKIRSLNESWAHDKSNQQAEILDLRDKLLTKSKELERLQSGAAAQSAPVIEQARENLARNDENLAGINSSIMDKDMQILKLKGLLTEKEGQIALQNNKINEQGAVLGFADNKVDDLNKRTVRIRQSLSGGDKALDELKARIADLKQRAAQPAISETPELKAKLDDWKRRLDATIKELDQKETTIADLTSQLEKNKRMVAAFEEQDASLAQKDAEIKRKDASLQQKDIAIARYKRIADEFQGQIEDARASEQAANNRLEASRRKMEMLVDNLGSFKANAKTASERAAGFSEKIYELEDRLQKEVTDATQELKFLKQTLAERDKEVVNLKKDILLKDDQLKFFYRKMDDATKTLNESTLNHDQTPTPPSGSSPVSAIFGGAAPWDPKDNDAYALGQRLAITAKETQAARQRAVEQEAMRRDLEAKFAAKEQELRAQKEDYNKILSAEAAQKQSKDWRAKETALRAVDLERKIARHQVELSAIYEEIDDYKQTAEKASEELKARDKDAQDLKVKLDKSIKELAAYKVQIKEKDEEIGLQRQAIDHEVKKFETLKKDLNQANKLVDLGEVKFGGKDLSIQDLKDNLSNAQIRERDYKSQIKGVEANLRESYAMVKEGEQRLSALKTQLAGKEDHVAALKKEIDRLQKLLRQKNDSVQTPLASSPTQKQ